MKAFFQELFRTGIYKRTQGRITRQVTFAAMAVALGVALWQLSQSMVAWAETGFRFAVPGVLLLLGWWIAYRIVNVPAFADFLVAVEAEMNKVSWPTRSELFRASVVVLFTIFALATLLAVYDFVWRVLFHNVIGIL